MFIGRKKFIRICQKTNGRCFYCNSNEASDVDHFISQHTWRVSWGLEDSGSFFGNLHDLENLFLACKSCNSKKGTKSPDSFMGGTFKAWDRNFRANQRIGLLEGMGRYE